MFCPVICFCFSDFFYNININQFNTFVDALDFEECTSILMNVIFSIAISILVQLRALAVYSDLLPYKGSLDIIITVSFCLV